jgi:signal transduction histidine kinase
VSQTDPAPADPHQEISLAAPEEVYKQSMKAVGKLVERITPWLLDFGSWIFGGLIAFNLLVVAALITVGPVDPAITVSTAAFALALPLELAGLLLLRLDQDLKHVGFEEEVAQAFQEVGPNVREQVASRIALELWPKRRTRIVLLYALWILALSVVLTLTGMAAALWHMAWWIGVVFFAMVLISQGMVIVAIVTSQPPDSQEEQERKRRSREEMTKQAKAQDKKNEERA